MQISWLRWVFSILIYAAAGPAFSAVPEVKPGQDYVGVSYDITTLGTISVYAGARNVDGKVAVCGLVWYSNSIPATKIHEPEFTEKMTFTLAGKGLTVSSRIFNRYKSEAAAANGLARCAVTTSDWKPVYARSRLQMDLGNITIDE